MINGQDEITRKRYLDYKNDTFILIAKNSYRLIVRFVSGELTQLL